MRILFQGDSITDAGRDKRNYHDLGEGYPKYAAEHIRAAHPDVDFEFINFGVSGNRTGQLFDRIYADGIAFQPDVISILIGINDVWGRSKHNILTTDAQIALNYRCILERIKNETNAKIVVLSPFVLDAPGGDVVREDTKKLVSIVQMSLQTFTSHLMSFSRRRYVRNPSRFIIRLTASIQMKTDENLSAKYMRRL